MRANSTKHGTCPWHATLYTCQVNAWKDEIPGPAQPREPLAFGESHHLWTRDGVGDIYIRPVPSARSREDKMISAEHVLVFRILPRTG